MVGDRSVEVCGGGSEDGQLRWRRRVARSATAQWRLGREAPPIVSPVGCRLERVVEDCAVAVKMPGRLRSVRARAQRARRARIVAHLSIESRSCTRSRGRITASMVVCGTGCGAARRPVDLRTRHCARGVSLGIGRSGAGRCGAGRCGADRCGAGRRKRVTRRCTRHLEVARAREDDAALHDVVAYEWVQRACSRRAEDERALR